MGKKKYSERSVEEKIHSQWTKLTGLHSRAEWSAAVLRAATAAELAANLAIRHELKARSDLDDAFINHLLKWANGLSGKLDKLLLPLLKGDAKHKEVKNLCKLAQTINDKRNAIAHQGEFCNEKVATQMVGHCREFVEGLVRLYDDEFRLKESTD